MKKLEQDLKAALERHQDAAHSNFHTQEAYRLRLELSWTELKPKRLFTFSFPGTKMIFGSHYEYDKELRIKFQIFRRTDILLSQLRVLLCSSKISTKVILKL